MDKAIFMLLLLFMSIFGDEHTINVSTYIGEDVEKFTFFSGRGWSSKRYDFDSFSLYLDNIDGKKDFVVVILKSFDNKESCNFEIIHDMIIISELQENLDARYVDFLPLNCNGVLSYNNYIALRNRADHAIVKVWYADSTGKFQEVDPSNCVQVKVEEEGP